jgi:excinuclease ABC subunit C
MQAFVERYYSETNFYPDEVLLSAPAEDPDTLSELLRQLKGKAVPVRVPERGDKAGLARIVETNARLHLDEWKVQRERQSQDRIPHAVKALQKDLRLQVLPRRIECFDISHLGGTGTVASCIVFEDGRAKKSEYRTYRIRSAEAGKPDDFESIREVIARRYRRLIDEGGRLPDLVVVDGGKGQLSSAVEAMRDVDVYGRFPVVGLAKRLEEVFFPQDTEAVLIPKASASLQLLQRVRNEAHRFAVTFQQKQRKRQMLRSELLDIPGIGQKTVQKLLKAFGSLKRIRHATTEELEEVVGKATTRRIVEYYTDEGAAKAPPPIE